MDSKGNYLGINPVILYLIVTRFVHPCYTVEYHVLSIVLSLIHSCRRVYSNVYTRS